jgi:hypothetical protein
LGLGGWIFRDFGDFQENADFLKLCVFLKIADFPPSYSWVHFGAEAATVTLLKCAAAASRPPLPHPFL